jgi:hypothetical protein
MAMRTNPLLVLRKAIYKGKTLEISLYVHMHMRSHTREKERERKISLVKINTHNLSDDTMIKELNIAHLIV